MRYDALIIGAGMSGLAAGIRLAQFGKRVAILERHYLWGGLNSFYKLGGRRFDTGLHALTNFTPRGARKGPLAKILRQLRISHDELRLGEHEHSEVCFLRQGELLRLKFANDPELFFSEVAREFPGQVDALRRLADEVPDFTDMGSATDVSTRRELARRLADPLLVEMLLAPTCFYGAAGENDLPWDQFGVLYRSIFSEGLARPAGGIKPVLDLLLSRFAQAGGELRLRSGVERILARAGRACGVRLDDGTELEAERVFSSAGWIETMRLAGLPAPQAEAGVLSFVETLSVLDRTPAELGHRAAITFFNDSERFHWERPEALTDPRSGVVCCPTNYACSDPAHPSGEREGGEREGLMRVTVLADHRRWTALEAEDYRSAKQAESQRALASAARFAPDPRPHTVFQDTFTPRTIERFTWHVNGTVYGSPAKRLDGRTGLDGLYLIGTDQGLVGVIGALMSGIGIANRYGLRDEPTQVAAGEGGGGALQ